MIDTVFRWVTPRFWRWRIARHEASPELTAAFMKWKREHPDRWIKDKELNP